MFREKGGNVVTQSDTKQPRDYRTYGRSRSVRLPAETYHAVGMICSVTACTKDRVAYFSEPAIAGVVADTWREIISDCHHRLWAQCVMPDHVHALLEVGSPDISVGDCVGRAKSNCFRKLRASVILQWQDRFYDHVLKDGEDPRVQARYIVNNPVRQGLVENWELWPFTFLDPEAL